MQQNVWYYKMFHEAGVNKFPKNEMLSKNFERDRKPRKKKYWKSQRS